MPELRPVHIAGIGLLCPAGVGRAGAGPIPDLGGAPPGEVPGFRPAALIADRKQLKLMTRAVQLGLAATALAVQEAGGAEVLAAIPPHRRGIFVAASPQAGSAEELTEALLRGTGPDGGFDLRRFAEDGAALIHPLWLVKGLSNNVLGFASAIHDLQGVNASWCDGPAGGRTALREGYFAVAEGRAEAALAGGSDCLRGAEALLDGRPAGEGAAFLLLRAGEGPRPFLPALLDALPPDPVELGELGAAALPVRLARHLLAGA